MANISVIDGLGQQQTLKVGPGSGADLVPYKRIDTIDAGASVDIGGVTETAPGTDTASSGLNGRLQRIAQRLTSLIAVIPPAPQSVDITANAITVTASIYGSGNVVGGVLTFANALRAVPLSGVVNSIWVSDKKVQSDSRVLWLFKANPSSSTFTDKNAPVLNVADIPKLIGRYPLGAPASDLGTHTLYQLDAIGKVVQAAGTTLYGVLITLGTPTPNSTSDISVGLGIVQD